LVSNLKPAVSLWLDSRLDEDSRQGWQIERVPKRQSVMYSQLMIDVKAVNGVVEIRIPTDGMSQSRSLSL
jgi:hypothetical protein